jgi:Ran GTPase-activating protein (RanGAP) involved in mRNA processing and transport
MKGKLSSVGEEDSSNHSHGSLHGLHNLSPPLKVDLKKEYTRFCKLYSSEPLEIVATPLERASFGRDPTIVDLKGRGLRGVDCIALGKILASDAPISHLNLSDCLLLPQGFEALLEGLAKNTRLHTLELRGNNIQGTMTCVLAKLLKVNSSLKRLLLEWNCLGTTKESFSLFCAALAVNTGLEVLDLRNNQLNAEAAIELATALHKNKSIRHLDLRWNSIGVAGAKAIWDALRTNFTLQNIQLCGNFIPDEIVCYIEQCLQHQQEREKMMEEYASRTSILTRQLQKTEKEYKHELETMVSVFDAEETELKNALDSATDLARDFETKLRSEASKTHLLSNQIENLKASLACAAEKEETLRKALDLKEEHTEHLESLFKEEVQKLKSIHESQLSLCQDEIIALKEEGKKMASKINMLEDHLKAKVKDCQLLEDSLEAFKMTNAELRRNFEERIKNEREKWTNWRAEQETAEQYEIRQLESELKHIQSTMMDHIRHVEKAKVDAENKIRQLEITIVTAKSQAETELSRTRNKLKEEHDAIIEDYRRQLNELKGAKEKLEGDMERLNCQLLKLDSEKSSLTRQNESYRKQISHLEEQLASMSEREKFEAEIEQKNKLVEKLESDKATLLKTNESLRSQNLTLEKQLSEKDSAIFASLNRARTEVKELTELLSTPK